MTNIANKAQGMGLALLTKLASSELLDQLKLRKFVENSLYQGSKAGFKTLSKTQQWLKPSSTIDKQRLPNQSKSLFDLNVSEEQQMTVDAMDQFAKEIIYPLVHDADHLEKFPEILWQHATDLGLNNYALPEAFGGVATEKNQVSNILIAECLAKGDFSITAGLLSTFSVINALTQWGSKTVQTEYLQAFADHANLKTTFAVQEETPAFNPHSLKSKAQHENGQYFIDGEKTLVMLAETADLYIVSAMLDG